jgi:predicted fused transcriptional regulator/phosphomethylpyrimidine kinase
MTPERNEILNEVSSVYNYIRIIPDFKDLIPEVRTNISMSLKNAKSIDDIAAIEGRITVVNGFPLASGPIKFGVSNHTARLLLTAQKLDPIIRAVMNIKYRPEFIQLISTTTLKVVEFKREIQPENIRNKDSSTMQWMIESIYEDLNCIPDIIWDCGEPEKEPMIRLFANDADDLIEKLKKILLVLRSAKLKSN